MKKPTAKSLPVELTRYLEADRQRALSYSEMARKPVTRQRDQAVWRQFSIYLGSKDPWTATPEELAAWCASRADRGESVNTIESDLTRLSFLYERMGKGYFQGRPGVGTLDESPARHALVRATMRGIWRLHPPSKRSQKPLLLDGLERLIDAQPDNLWGKRNRALFALSWAGARRFSEILNLDLQRGGDGEGFIKFTKDGTVITLLRSKAHPHADAPEFYGIPVRRSVPRYCPTLLLKDFIQSAGLTAGPVFRTIAFGRVFGDSRTGKQTARRLAREGLASMGYPVEDYGLRSFRSGCIAWLISEGVHPKRVAEHTGHKNVGSIFKYLRSSASIASSPLADTRWIR